METAVKRVTQDRYIVVLTSLPSQIVAIIMRSRGLQDLQSEIVPLSSSAGWDQRCMHDDNKDRRKNNTDFHPEMQTSLSIALQIFYESNSCASRESP